MKLFIMELERYFNYQIKVEEIDGERTKLIIPNLIENDSTYENIEFVLPMHKEKVIHSEKLNISCSKLWNNKNEYKFENGVAGNEKNIYALLNNSKQAPSDIYIPVNMKEKVKVLKKIRFYDSEPDYGDFIAQLYFVKIKLSKWDTIPFYCTFPNPTVLDRHIVFSRDYSSIEIRECNTCIYLKHKMHKEYISLSEL